MCEKSSGLYYIARAWKTSLFTSTHGNTDASSVHRTSSLFSFPLTTSAEDVKRGFEKKDLKIRQELDT